MLINLKVKTLDARTHEFSIDNEITIRQFKDQIAEKTNIAAENQRIIYQGRVLADEKQVKEYDVAGKVLHVAERPPFSQRGSNSRNNDEPRPLRNVGTRGPINMRNSPFFRALDGMLVGTMAIPVNGPIAAAAPARAGPQTNRFPNSSSFCVNRITVALHMIDCANNIAAYLENPEVGLNNQSLDILQRGRWTMESTVVEVGVSSTDLPPNNNIIDLVQDAVTAALTRNTPGRNYTVVQLPTVYTNDEDVNGAGAGPGAAGEARQEGPLANGEAAPEAAAAEAVGGENTEGTTAAAVIIEDVETDDETIDERSELGPFPYNQEAGGDEAAPAAAGEGESPAADGSNVSITGLGPRRRTRPQVLADVITRYRTVQTRLAPFVDRYYDILQNDQQFEPEDPARATAQRVFDRVSEAFHYLSHAQHAISDLMLDLSQPGPRVLTCRPILVEQSGYIRSNNIFTSNMMGSPHGEFVSIADMLGRPRSQNAQAAQGGGQAVAPAAPAQAQPSAPATAAPAGLMDPATSRNAVLTAALSARVAAQAAQAASAAAATAAELAAGATAAAASASAASAAANEAVEDPVDDPMVAPNPPNANGAQAQQIPLLDPQAQVARLIQAVVNSATQDSDVHVEFNAPNIMSINLPVTVRPRAPPAAAAAAAPNPDNAEAEGANAEGGTAASTSSGGRSGDQRANTLPTTATQTRSTSRPQIQIGGNNNWAGRITPTHTAFDRFLPCNSHHIRDPEQVANQISNNNNNGSNANRIATQGTMPVITDRLPRGQSGSRHVWPSRRRTAAAAAATTPGQAPERGSGAGVSSSSSGIRRPANWRQVAYRQGRQMPTFLTNLLVTNLRNNAPTAQPAGSGETTPPTARPTSQARTPTSPTTAEQLRQRFGRNRIYEQIHFSPIDTSRLRLPSLSSASGSSPESLRNAGGAPVTSPTTGVSPSSNQGSINLRTQLTTFLNQTVFEGAIINEENMPAALDRAMAWFDDCLLYLPQYERPEYNSRDSVCNILRLTLRRVIDLCNGPSTSEAALIGMEFEQALKQICEQFRTRLYSVLFVCIGRANAELYWRQLMRLLTVPLRLNFRNEALQFLCIYIDPTIPGSADTVDAQQFLVMRTTLAETAAVVNPLDNDVEMADVASSSSTSNGNGPPAAPATAAEMDQQPAQASGAAMSSLPSVSVGSEAWHNNVPNEWLPVITRDLQTQIEQPRQPPYSDAYISGMSAKRRKLIQNEKPNPSVECLIASGVQQAIQSTGVGAPNASSQPLNVDAVISAIAHDHGVQASYTEAVRGSARERLRNDNDFKPSKYPQINKFAGEK